MGFPLAIVPAAKAILGIGAGKAAAAGATKMAGGAAFKSALGKALKMGFAPDPTQKVMPQVLGRLAPDAFFGGMAAMQTPGDIGDKAIAGLTQAVGGGLGGGLTTGLTGGRLGMIGEFAGGYGGDMLGFSVGENLMRAKDALGGGKGETPYERMGREQQEQFAQQIRNEALMGAGLIPGFQEQYGTPPSSYLQDLGLAG